jgi:predicted O-linked N-acetylglucosamine transferase (SPINDLY family)
LSGNVGSRAFHNARLQKRLKKLKEQGKTLLPAAIAAHQRGQYSEAKTLCQQMLRDQPDRFEVLHLLGVLELDGTHVDEAEKFLRRAVEVQPGSAEAHSNLGLAYARLKRFEEARACQEMAIVLKPNFPTALTNLGSMLLCLGRYELALEAHDRAIRLKPDYADAYGDRGMALWLLERIREADESFDRALALQPLNLGALLGKAMVSKRLRRFDAALRALDAVFAINPRVPVALVHRGQLKLTLGKFDEAQADFDAALAIDPTQESAWGGKANHGLLTNKIAQAIHACHKVLENNPNSETAIGFLGSCHAAQGDVATALQLFDRALMLKPNFDDVMLKKIFAMEFLADADFVAHQAVRREWWDRIGSKFPRRELQRSSHDPEKRIVVGYVSSDFMHHSAALTFMPILRHHDHRQFEIIAYSCSHHRDGRTEECQALVDRWVDASCVSDDDLADRIQRDQVDVLVDLSGHSSGNRLAVFARKPAPVQVSACGSVTGTGLPAMDYLLADPVIIPEAVRHLFAEQIYDLPCCITIDAAPDVKPTEPPMLRNDFVTFGVFNRSSKISDAALDVWSVILQQIPGSRIIVKDNSLSDSLLRDALLGRFVAHGIAVDRVACLGPTPRLQHLSEFANVDISLDPFPQNGGVSTWESLQMGVPVICKLGHSACSRAGGAIVTAIGLNNWVAEDDDGYVAIARKFASLPDELRTLRAELPARVATSNAGNNEFYTRCVEAGYRQFWRRYCATQG